MSADNRIGDFVFLGQRYYVEVYPAAMTATQLVITDAIGEIQSVCYVNQDDIVFWKFNPPATDVRMLLELEILKIVKKWRDAK